MKIRFHVNECLAYNLIYYSSRYWKKYHNSLKGILRVKDVYVNIFAPFRAALTMRVCHHRLAQHVGREGARATLRRIRRPQHRNVLRIQLRLRHQPSQGFGSEVG